MTVELIPICPMERNHDVLTEPDCWACGLIKGLWDIATGTDEDPMTIAMETLDESVEWKPKGAPRSTDPVPCSMCGKKVQPWELDDSGRCADCAP
jgi:hypothetical protein